MVTPMTLVKLSGSQNKKTGLCERGLKEGDEGEVEETEGRVKSDRDPNTLDACMSLSKTQFNKIYKI